MINQKLLINDNLLNQYIIFYKHLKSVKKQKKLIQKMDTKIVPYEIPKAYSLQSEIEELAVMTGKIEFLNKKMCRNDLDSLKNDWQKVGKDLNEAVRKSGRSNTRITK